MISNNLDTFMAALVLPPTPVSVHRVEQLARECFAVDAVAERLTGERDENFRLSTARGEEYLFKIASAFDDGSVVDFMTEILLHVERVDPGIPCPRVCRDRGGRTQIGFQDDTGALRQARLLTYLPGRPLRFAPRSRQQRGACGSMAARLGIALQSFCHPAAYRPLIWDLRQLAKMPLLLQELPDFPQAALVTRFAGRFATGVLPRLASVRHQVIHNDLNVRNVLMDAADESMVTGIIDYGDAVHAPLIADVAIMAAEQITEVSSARETIAEIVAAYNAIQPFTEAETELLDWVIAARVVMSIVIPSWYRHKNPAGTHYDRVDAAFARDRMAIAHNLICALPETSGPNSV